MGPVNLKEQGWSTLVSTILIKCVKPLSHSCFKDFFKLLEDSQMSGDMYTVHGRNGFTANCGKILDG